MDKHRRSASPPRRSAAAAAAASSSTYEHWLLESLRNRTQDHGIRYSAMAQQDESRGLLLLRMRCGCGGTASSLAEHARNLLPLANIQLVHSVVDGEIEVAVSLPQRETAAATALTLARSSTSVWLLGLAQWGALAVALWAYKRHCDAGV